MQKINIFWIFFLVFFNACTFHRPFVGTDGRGNSAILIPYERDLGVPEGLWEKGKKEVPQFPGKGNKPVWI